MSATEPKVTATPPRENLVRAVEGITLDRSAGLPMPTLTGHFAVWDSWTEIRSAYEGNFMERFSAGSMAKTLTEGTPKVLFQHGQDPQVGNKPLGNPDRVAADEKGAFYSVPLFDTSYNRDLIPGLEAGVYGASFRFSVVREDFVQRPKKTDHNPRGLPERTVQEARVLEFGPVTFPAYASATAGLRSMTDEFLFDTLTQNPERLEALVGRSGISLNGLSVPAEDERRDGRLYERSVEFVSTSAWAMHPDALETVMQIIAERASGHKPTQEEIRERIGVRAEQDTASGDSPVRVIQVGGPITPKASFMSDVSGGTSIDQFRSEFNDALASEDVKAILLNIDSPGGSASLIPEMGAEMLAARGTKPIVASVNTFAASAAYWLAAQADEIAVSPSGKVGSIGVWTSHTDISAAQDKMGIKTTLVSAGKYKVDGNPYEPLSDSAREELQQDVDTFYGMFVDAVAAGRGVDTDTVESDFGQGRMIMADAAVKAGMADTVETFQQTLARLEKQHAEPDASGRSTHSEPEPSEATTHSQTTSLFRFVDPPKHLKE